MAELGTGLRVRDLALDDFDAVVRIDAAHTRERDDASWRRVFPIYVGRNVPLAFAIGADVGDGLAGYLFGEVRAVEFGADPAGWVFSVGVDPTRQRQGIARALLAEAKRRFALSGVRHVRTMVKRNDVAILSFFRSAGFVGGPFVQLEVDLREDA